MWEVPLSSQGQCRNVIGQLAERLTAAYVGGVRHKSDSTKDYCPDVSVKTPVQVLYYESKAVGLTNQAFVYGGRLEKDREFVRVGYPLAYVIWCHRTPTKNAQTVEGLERLVLASIYKTYIISFDDIAAICGRLALEPLNSKYGGSNERPEYGSGYRISLSMLDPWVSNRWENGLTEERVQSWTTNYRLA